MVCFIRLRLSSTFSVQVKLFKFVSAVLAGFPIGRVWCVTVENWEESNMSRTHTGSHVSILQKKVSIFFVKKLHDISLFLLSASLIQVVAWSRSMPKGSVIVQTSNPTEFHGSRRVQEMRKKPQMPLKLVSEFWEAINRNGWWSKLSNPTSWPLWSLDGFQKTALQRKSMPMWERKELYST